MSLFLSKADVRKIVREELQQVNDKLTQIMSALSDYTQRVNTHLDKLDTGLAGLTTDIQELKTLIEKLQNSPGPITPEDQALLDALEARVKSAADKAAALDAETPPTPPPAG